MKKTLVANKENQIIWDVVVIGGGPAGMTTAARASSRGRRVLLLEKNPNLGKKLLISGGGRCNVTNNKPLVREMLSQYRKDGKFLFSTFMQYGVKESIVWFKERGVDLVEENEGRLFPHTHKALTIRDTLAEEMKKEGVVVKNKAAVAKITKDTKTNVFEIQLESRDKIFAQSCVVATGGTSRPETGSDGTGFRWLKSLGHTIVPNSFSLVPLALKTRWTKDLSGITLPSVKMTVLCDGKKQQAKKGKILFTHVGVTGPTVLNMSKEIGELLEGGEVVLALDLFPQYDAGEFKLFVRDLLTTESNKKIKNVLATLLPEALVKGLLSEIDIDGETPCHSVSASSRADIMRYFKAVPLPVKSLLGADKAVVSAGGVALEEVNFKTMESRLVPGLFLVGDVLNIDRPSGGYSLQLCWSTGFVAGSNA